MPEIAVQRKKAKGLGGDKGDGGTKGVGIGQSVLEMQQQIGNDQTVKTVLGPDVPGQFKAKAGRGKGGPLFFASSTYKELSKLLTTYAAKQGAKGGAWRRGQVGTMDNLLESWFSKKQKGNSESDKAKLAAMTWLQPKVRQELSSLNGTKNKEPEVPSGYTSVPAQDDAPAQEAPPEEQAPEQEPEPLTMSEPAKDEPEGDTPYTGVPAKEEAQQQSWTKGKGSGFRGSFALGGARKKAQDLKNGYGAQEHDDEVDDQVDDIQQDSVKEEESSLESDTRPSAEDEKQEQNSDSQQVSITSSSSDTNEDPVVETLPDPKYSEFKALDKHYDMEFKRGGVHLADIYKDGIRFAPDMDKVKEQVTKGWKWSPRTFDKYWHELERIFGGVQRIGPEKAPKPELTPSMDSDELFQNVEVSSVTKEDSKGNALPPEAIERRKKDKRWEAGMGDWKKMSITSVPTRDSESNSYDSSQIRSMEDDKRRAKAKAKFIGEITNSEALLVKKKTKEQERAKYALKLGSTLKRGPKEEILDTKDMASNFSGNGFGIFVMGQDGQVYVGSHKVGVFHHSSFLAGGNVAGAGEMAVSGGKLVELTNKSGHYQPDDAHNVQVISELKDAGIAPTSYKYKTVDAKRNVKLYGSAQEYVESLEWSVINKVGKHFYK